MESMKNRTAILAGLALSSVQISNIKVSFLVLTSPHYDNDFNFLNVRYSVYGNGNSGTCLAGLNSLIEAISFSQDNEYD